MKRRTAWCQALSVLTGVALVAAVLAPHAGADIPVRVRQAVTAGLDHLKEQQNDDGSWPGHYGNSPGVVGLILLAFFAHGEVPGRGPYKETIDKALDYILASAQDDGLISRTGAPPMYNHGFATLALAEAYGMSKRPEIERALRKAVDLIVRTQNSRGGWRYQPRAADDDITVSGCQLVALRAAENAGINVPRKTIENGLDYIESCYAYGGFAYTPGGAPGTARTGIGVLLLQLLGRENNEKVAKGVEYMKTNPPRHPGSYFYYATYYCAQAMYQYGGAEWKAWDRDATEHLLRLQIRSGPERGSWPETGSAGGKHYATAMALLALEVSWRYLPIYQR
jgi:hypothetical protein